MISSWGLTETAPMATAVHFPIDRAGVIGIPPPGIEIKLAPGGRRLEICVRGPNVTPGYWKRPDLTEKAFDEDGWLRDRRRRPLRGSGRSGEGRRVRRPRRREFQAQLGNLGERRQAASRGDRGRCRR